MLDLCTEERLSIIRSERWIGYADAERVVNELESLFARPRTSRMPGILLVGETNQGKSTILRRFCSRHPKVQDLASEHLVLPVMLLECPPVADEGRLLNALLNALKIPYVKGCSPDTKHRMLRAVLPKIGLRILILDEVHNVLVSSPNRQRQFLIVLKYLTNTLSLPIVLAGTEEARLVLTNDAQLARRFRTVKLSKWRNLDQFTMLLNSFEQLLPLKKPSFLNKLRLVEELFALTDGILGEVAYLLTEAACAAVLSGEESITLKGIRSVDFIRPPNRHADKTPPEGGEQTEETA